VQTGIGKDAVIRAVNAAAGGGNRPGLIILAGTCGGLIACEDCPPIASVVDELVQHKWIPFMPGPARGGVSLVGVDRIVSTPDDKAALARATGAAVVDMEAHAFAAHCQRLDIRWSVVRAVSDTPEETLPGEVLGWVTPAGDTRPVRAVLDMIRKPSLIPHVRAAMSRADRVLPLAGGRVVQIIRAWQAPTSPRTLAQAGSIA
jgi:nucleoside phosphorylase